MCACLPRCPRQAKGEYSVLVCLLNIFLVLKFLTFSDKYHGTIRNRNDGIEIPLKLFVVIICAVALLSPLVVFNWIVKKVHLWSILNGDINPISLMMCMGASSVVLVDFSAIFFLVALAVSYVKITETSLKFMM